MNVLTLMRMFEDLVLWGVGKIFYHLGKRQEVFSVLLFSFLPYVLIQTTVVVNMSYKKVDGPFVDALAL